MDDEGMGRVRRAQRGHRCSTAVCPAEKPGCPVWVRPDDLQGAFQFQQQQRRGPWKTL